MKYQLSTFGGENILLGDDKYIRILKAWDDGMDEFCIGEQRIPRKAVSFLGFTKEAAEQIRIDESEYERSLPLEEQKRLQETKYKNAIIAASKKNNDVLESGRNSYERRWKSVGKEDVPVIVEERTDDVFPKMTAEEDEGGSAMYWVDKNGQKMYS